MEDVRAELRNIINGNGFAGEESKLKKIQNFLRRHACAGETGENQKRLKSEEEKLIVAFSEEGFFFNGEISESFFISEGAEQKVYKYDDYSVIKVNSGIFYEYWLDYVNSLLIHNFFFTSTSYDFLGFITTGENMFAVVKQDFIVANEVTNLVNLEKFLRYNNFFKIRNNDYRSDFYGVLLEDLHDENVLSRDGVFFFIDTVFYLA